MKSAFFMMIICSLGWGWTHLGNNIRGWKDSTVTFYVNSSNCPLSEAEVNDIIDSAMNTWNGVTDSKLVVKRATTTTTVSQFLNNTATELPVILCDNNFATQVGNSDVHVIPAATFKFGVDGNGTINYAGILLNAQNGAGANISSLSKGQVELTLAHEMGHALGLGHSSVTEALMFYSLGSKERPILTEDDIDGIVHIYPRNEFTGGVLGCSSVHNPNSSSKTDVILGMGTLLILLAFQVWLGRQLNTNPRQT